MVYRAKAVKRVTITLKDNLRVDASVTYSTPYGETTKENKDLTVSQAHKWLKENGALVPPFEVRT